MTQAPFFSILIPTMNRPQSLAVAVKTAMSQRYPDFEVIVSDNSTSDDVCAQNKALIDKYGHDSPIRYIRPPSWMNMPDHWEFASRHAEGRYVIILTDRFAMRPSALSILKAVIDKLPEDCRVISWSVNSSLSQSGVMYTEAFSGETIITSSLQMVSDFTALRGWRTTPCWNNHLPRMLNSCYRRDLTEDIRARHGRLFMPLSPDYKAAFMLLASSAQLAFIS